MKPFEYKSFALNKKSPYGIFLNHALLRMFENGQLHNIKKKWEVLPPQCSPLIKKGKSLSFSKLISLFTIIGIGGTLAMMVMVPGGTLGIQGAMRAAWRMSRGLRTIPLTLRSISSR